MARIEAITIAQHLPGYRRVRLACNHTLMLTTDDPLLAVGRTFTCRACTNSNEREINSIRTARGNVYYQAVLSCGHVREMKFYGPITYDTIGDFVGTMTPCRLCATTTGE